MGRRRSENDLAGVLIVDKPAGMTSHDVVARVRKAAGQSRVGHTGTLDPSATGVLVCCLGRATRLVQFLQGGMKTYAARIQLGVTTDTQDADGTELSRTSAQHISERALCAALTSFVGDIEQIPPMVSAVRVDGERLHVRARRGETVERAPRSVTVHDLVLDEFVAGEHPEASFLVSCSPGTYVRTLAHDVGEELGVGATLVHLRRVANGAFTLDDAHSLDAIEASNSDELVAMLCSVETAVRRSLPTVKIDSDDDARRLAQGGRATQRGQPGPFAIFYGDALVGIYRDAEDGTARAELVWMAPGALA